MGSSVPFLRRILEELKDFILLILTRIPLEGDTKPCASNFICRIKKWASEQKSKAHRPQKTREKNSPSMSEGIIRVSEK